ncbi:acetolactate synthase large subunit [Virgibacillus dakarensis]|uniref:Acetolactate synthase n=1 Tax=Lentibacillus populi TaxID=1827502 RepID=A0A9W5U0B0_9BACI|nr:acetolactate synthase large subunit [Lentibacillus populi]MBT2217001.1 acetolactate synthase large subunit [Virgibacillus dakarensis]MTW86934.1 acetolactate synthase large subunit [Virgibacillus dakarensis]GGB52583.1 acetolactate synthase [Lentibacillus populi]
MKASDLFVRCLENEGVKYIFGIPGEENTDLVDSLIGSNIEFIVVHHEQAAAFMADVYGRLTGNPGVCLATLGPGATNLLTGIGDAYLDHAPVVAITGQAWLERIHKESHQYVDIIGVFEEITKWNQQIRVAHTIPEIIRKAFKTAVLEKPGAVHIELPEDIAMTDTNGEVLPVTPLPISQPAEDEVRKAAEKINQAKKPIILAGNGVFRNDAAKALREFAEAKNIPVVNTFMAKGILPSDHPLTLYTVGMQSKDYVLCGFDLADCIITVGYDFVEYLPKYWNDEAMNKIVHIDSLPAEIDAYYPLEAELVGNVGESLKALSPHVKAKELWPEVKALKSQLVEKLHASDEVSSSPVKPQRIIADLKKAEKGEAIVISDVGAHKLWVARLYQPEKPNHTIISNGWAAMGIAVPGAIAAKLANPDKPVVAVTGDGAFLMNGVELATAKRLGVAMVIVIFHDEKYGLIEWKQLNKYDRTNAIAFTDPDFLTFAKSFGCKGIKVKHSDELLPALEEALASETIVLVDVDVDYSENVELTKTLGDYICKL